jgi:hypothetical protein
VARHEAAHAVIGRAALGVQVVRVVAAGDNPHCRTRFLFAGDTAEKIDAMERQAIIALAGLAVEKHSPKARETDWRNALAYCLRIVLLQDGIEGDDVSDEQYVKGEILVEQLRVKAAALVEANMPAIERVADALAERGQLDQADIDALIFSNQLDFGNLSKLWAAGAKNDRT